MKREIFLTFYLAFLIIALSTTSINAQLCATGCPDAKIRDKFEGDSCNSRTYVGYDGSDIQYCCTLADNIVVLCDTCMVGYKTQGNTCLQGCPITNCEDCGEETCLKCKEGFWWDNFAKTCPPCRPKCAACVSENKCTKCKSKTL